MYIGELVEKGIPTEIIELLKNRKIVKLDRFQEDAIEEGLLEGNNLLISAPTSSGKTLIGELALVNHACKNKGCFFIVSHKALAEEKYRLFVETYEANNWFNVAISTGDRSRFDENLGSYGIIIATYEKLSNLVISNPNLLNSVNLVVVDEIQMLGDPNRGSTLETLLIKLKSKPDIQIIGLSATIENPKDIGDWLNCKTIICDKRSIDLDETLWSLDKIISKDFNTKNYGERDLPVQSLNTIEIVEFLKDQDYFPLIVFGMKKTDVEKLADGYSRLCETTTCNQSIVQELKDSSEGTPTTRIICNLISKGIGLHTGDLTEFEREVIENAFKNGDISIVFSTTTLSTGVNLPAKTVIIDKCKREWGDFQDLGVHEYINMSGRAGRRGLQEKGTSIIIARNKAEQQRFSKYLDHDLKEIISQMVDDKKSFSQHILNLISSGIYNSTDSIKQFFENSYLNYIFQKKNEVGHLIINPLIDSNLIFLIDKKFIIKDILGNFELSNYGKVVVEKGIRPESFLHLKAFLDFIKEDINEDNFDSYISQIIYASTLTEEFIDRYGLIYASASEKKYFNTLNSRFNYLNLKEDIHNFKTTHILRKFIQGTHDEEIYSYKYVNYGKITNTTEKSSWMIESLCEIAQLSDYNFSEELIDNFITLKLRVKFGVPENTVNIRNIFFEEQIKGIGRKISMKLANNNIDSLSQIIDSDFDELSKIVGPKNAQKIRDGVIRFVKNENQRLKILHERRVRDLGRSTEYISLLYTAKGIDFENVVFNLLKSVDINCLRRDVGDAEAEPDLIICEDNEEIPVECKTKKDDTKSIGNSEAFDVLAKGLNYNRNHLMTIGKPLFSKTAIEKGYKEVTLLLHSCLAELVINIWEGKMSKEEVLTIFKKGGYIKIEQISPELI